MEGLTPHDVTPDDVGRPCASIDGTSIAIMQEMRNFLALMVCKGALVTTCGGSPATIADQPPHMRAGLDPEAVADVEP